MGLVQDAFKDAFSGFGGKKDMKQKKEETALDKVERLERELQEERARILNSMPKPPEPPKEDHYQAMSVDSRLDVLEHNINTILTEFNERLTNLERAIIKNIK